jgi:hypothetical protein
MLGQGVRPTAAPDAAARAPQVTQALVNKNKCDWFSCTFSISDTLGTTVPNLYDGFVLRAEFGCLCPPGKVRRGVVEPRAPRMWSPICPFGGVSSLVRPPAACKPQVSAPQSDGTCRDCPAGTYRDCPAATRPQCMQCRHGARMHARRV